MNTDNIKAIREACISNAESLLGVAERELGKGADHACFHLALIALEEIGKIILVTIDFSQSSHANIKSELIIDDHVKKIFWALWSELLMSNKVESFTDFRNWASTLHKERLSYLYVDPNNPIMPVDKIPANTAKKLIDLAKLRLEFAKNDSIVDTFSSEDISEFNWFLKSTDDSEMRQLIFASNSLKMFETIGNARDWIKWLKQSFEMTQKEMEKFAEEEIKRGQPKEEEQFHPKYKMKIRIQSQSHKIKNDAFTMWNENFKDIKIYKVDQKKLPDWAKSEMMIEFIFPKIITIERLWEHSFFVAKLFVIALNISTKGIFWWNAPKSTLRFYDELLDLEEGRKGTRIEMHLADNDLLNWGDAELDSKEIGNLTLLFSYLSHNSQKLKPFIQSYSQGLTLLAKADIHLHVQGQILSDFFNAFKQVILINGDWDGFSDLYEASKKVFKNLETFELLSLCIKRGLEFEQNNNLNIKAIEAAYMKVFCDSYIHLKAKEAFENYKSNSALHQ